MKVADHKRYLLKKHLKTEIAKYLISFCPFPLCLSLNFLIAGGGGRVVRRCWVNIQCQGVLLIWIIVGQGPIALAVGAGGDCLDIFSLIYHFFSFTLSLEDGLI